jgi:F-box and WD-40 domain protein CDC4
MWNVKTGKFVKDLLTDLSGVWQVKFNERRCVAAVQRKNMTYIEVSLSEPKAFQYQSELTPGQVLDFGASRDGVPADQRGRRIVVNSKGQETEDIQENTEVEAA